MIDERNKVEIELSKKSVELSEILRAKIYPKKNNFVFMSNSKTLIYIRSISRSTGIYYLYDIHIINFDENYNIINTVYAKYGKSIGPKSVTMYCYSRDDSEQSASRPARSP